MTHGHFSTYVNQKCRCELCKAAWRTYMKQHRLKRLALGLCPTCPARIERLTRCPRCHGRMLHRARMARRAA